jgi:hypothetical protein
MVVVMLSIEPLMVLKALSTVPPCSIMTIGLSLNFGTVARSSYKERIELQSLKTQSVRQPLCRIYPDKVGGVHNTLNIN